MITYDRGIIPAEMKYIVPNYADYGLPDSVAHVVAFKYNVRGEVTQIKYVDLYSPGYDYSANYEYDGNGNVTRIVVKPEGKSAITEFTQYEFYSYDHQPNFMGGNLWLKYILFNWYYPFYDLIFSRNNPKDYAWYFDVNGYGYVHHSSFTYNDKGFATEVMLHTTDTNGNFVGDFTKWSTSTCDVLRPDLHRHIGSPKLSEIMQRMRLKPFFMQRHGTWKSHGTAK